MAEGPFEIIAAPLTAWLGPVGEPMPAIDAVPAGNWLRLGTSGDKSETEDGVHVSNPQKIDYVRAAGALGPVKAFRTEEDLKITFKLMDMTLEQYAKAMNHNPVTAVAAGVGSAGYKHMSLQRGKDVTTKCLLLRGPSPYGDGWNLQYEVPKVVHVGNPEPIFKKGSPAELLFEYMAIEDPDFAYGPFGRLVAQMASAT